MCSHFTLMLLPRRFSIVAKTQRPTNCKERKNKTTKIANNIWKLHFWIWSNSSQSPWSVDSSFVALWCHFLLRGKCNSTYGHCVKPFLMRTNVEGLFLFRIAFRVVVVVVAILASYFPIWDFSYGALSDFLGGFFGIKPIGPLGIAIRLWAGHVQWMHPTNITICWSCTQYSIPRTHGHWVCVFGNCELAVIVGGFFCSPFFWWKVWIMIETI